MKAIILAAGQGSRLGTIGAGLPKCLIEIEGNTLLEIQLNVLHSCGIEDISVVRGYEAEKLNVPGIKYYDNANYLSTNMLYSLFCARDEIKGELLIQYSDIIYEEEVLKRILEARYDIVIGVMTGWKEAIRQRNKVALEELEMVSFDSENRVTKIGKHLIEEYETQGQFIGIVKCSSRGSEILKRNYDRAKRFYEAQSFGQGGDFDGAWLTDILQEMTNIGVPLQCVITERGWMEIDTPEDYKRALTDTRFVRRLVKVKTDWGVRAEIYNNLDWVNKDELLNAMVELSGISNGMRILDLGTGTGKVLIAFKTHWPDSQCYGVDSSSSMLDRIDRRFGLNLYDRDIENLDCFEDNYFDVVTARMVFHHVKNLEGVMEEIYRVLKPGGSFILCEGTPPDLNSIGFYKAMFQFKEDRATFLVDDLINLFVGKDFENLTSRTIIMKNMSINNWLANSGLPFRNIDIIKKMHYECDLSVKKAYKMEYVKDDILMDWKFSIVSGTK